MTGSLFMMNVGDGLETFFKIPPSPQIDGGEIALLDFGSFQGIKIALRGYWRGIQKTRRPPDVFILSHFHADHYNGLFGRPPLSLNRVYFPIIPNNNRRSNYQPELYIGIAVYQLLYRLQGIWGKRCSY